MLQKIKDARRRGVEKALNVAGVHEKTFDEVFELEKASFYDLVDELNKTEPLYRSAVEYHRHFYTQWDEYKKLLCGFYTKTDIPELEYHNVSLALTAQSKTFLEFSHSNDVHRRSSEQTCYDNALNPLKVLLEEILPGVATEIKEREKLLTDFDSCVRRLGVVKEKHEKAVEASTTTPSARNTKKVEETVLEVAKFQGKADIARFMYTEQNTKAISTIKKARRKINTMIDAQLVAVVTTQAEYFSRCSQDLNGLVGQLPPDQVEEMRSCCHRYSSISGYPPIVHSKKSSTRPPDHDDDSEEERSDFEEMKQPSQHKQKPVLVTATTAPHISPAASMPSAEPIPDVIAGPLAGTYNQCTTPASLPAVPLSARPPIPMSPPPRPAPLPSAAPPPIPTTAPPHPPDTLTHEKATALTACDTLDTPLSGNDDDDGGMLEM